MYRTNMAASPYTKGYSLAYPKRFLLAITANCDLRCVMCCLWGEEGQVKAGAPYWAQGQLTFDDVKRLVDDVHPWMPSLIFTGGEPLIHKQWYEMTRYAKSKGLRLFMATGGTLLERNAEKLVEVMDHLQISMDGPDPSVHDVNRDTDGSHSRIVKGIQKIDRLKKERGLKQPYINICCTITGNTWNHLERHLEFLESLDADINEVAFQHLEFTDEETLKEHRKVYESAFGISTEFWKGFLYQPDGIDVKQLVETVKKIKSRGSKKINSVVFRPDLTLDEVPQFYTTNKVLPRFQRTCPAPWHEVFVMPNGDVWTCADYVPGNIKQQSFRKIWNNAEYRRLRQHLLEHQTFPACKVCASLYIY